MRTEHVNDQEWIEPILAIGTRVRWLGFDATDVVTAISDKPVTHTRSRLGTAHWHSYQLDGNQWVSGADVQPAYRCASPRCPGFTYRASDRPHPADICGG